MAVKFSLDTKSELTVRPPRKDSEILQLGASYLAYEAALPPESQNPMPPLVDVNAAYQAARAAVDSASSGEHERAAAGEQYTAVMETITGRLQWAIKGRLRQFPNSPAMIEAWGVDTVMGATGRRLDFPTTQAGWIALLDSYIAKEESLLPEAQWTDPPLAEFETLREQMQTSDTARKVGLIQRREGIENRALLAAELKEDLMLALHTIIRRQYGSVIRTGLANWGFDVYTKQATSTSESTNESTSESDNTPVTEPVTEPVATTMSAPDTTLDTAPLTPAANGAAH